MNDAAHQECPSRQHVPIREYKTNMQEMIATIESFGIPKERIIMIGPPPFCLRLFKAHRKDSKAVKILRSSSALMSYCEACRKVAESANVTYVDTNKQFKESERGDRLLSDGLHLSSSGSAFLAQILEPIVTEKIKAFNNWDSVKQNFVPWNQFAKMTAKATKRRKI